MTQICDRYADEIIAGNPHQFDAIEIQGVREYIDQTDPQGSFCEVDNDDPQFFSVYLHNVAGGVACVGDFSDVAEAAAYGDELAGRYGWPIYAYYKQH